MMRESTLEKLDRAIDAYNFNNYVSIEDNRLIDEELSEFSITPQEYLLLKEHEEFKHQAWENLSDEAKQVWGLIVNCPDELIDILTNYKSYVDLKKLCRYLRRQFGERKVVKRIIEEIRIYANIISKDQEETDGETIKISALRLIEMRSALSRHRD